MNQFNRPLLGLVFVSCAAHVGCVSEPDPGGLPPDDDAGGELDVGVGDAALPPPDLGACGRRYGDSSYRLGDATITSTEDLVALQGYQIITGSLRIAMDEDAAVAGLADLRCVGGDLRISGQALTSLEGLHGLEFVAGHAMIEDAPRLESLAGLRGLAIVGGELRVHRLDAIADLAGLTHLAHVGHLVIEKNPRLQSITGFGDMRAIPGTLLVHDNPLLADVTGLFGVRQLGTEITIVGNPSLSTCAVRNWIGALVEQGYDGEIAVHGNDDSATCE